MNLKSTIITLLAVTMLSSCWASGKQDDAKKKNEMNTIPMTTADFKVKIADYEKNPDEWKYLGDKPAIIDFYATWCGPCRALSPVMDELAGEYKGKINFYKVDTDKERELDELFGIRSIPSILFIPINGKPSMAQGALPKSELVRAINEILLNNK
ncbi:MAG: thioredoxin [Bacteroidales bacterium]|nr:thioredoxin [Bacteroidales bacterium]MCI2122379.1 thioredoxin [Bacteroidales bacterium]MCI2144812.1 thioredoxin [Bacteroidales bacterium]